MEASLWPVIVGGLLAGLFALGGIGVGLVGTARRDAAQERREAKKRREDKFEDLVAALYDFDHWIERHRRAAIDVAEAPQTMSPLAKVQSISSVYFPQFEEFVRELDLASTDHLNWIWSTDPKRGYKYDERMDQAYLDASAKYGQQLQSLLDALKKFAREEFQ